MIDYSDTIAYQFTPPATERKCQRCDKAYHRKPNVGLWHWERQRFCSARCREATAYEAWRGRQRAEAGVTTCLECDKPLTGCQLTFCSSSCSSTHHHGGDQEAHAYTYFAMSHHEIARRLGLTVTQVRRAEASALRKLKSNAAALRVLREYL
jgi:hypothetical protein